MHTSRHLLLAFSIAALLFSGSSAALGPTVAEVEREFRQICEDFRNSNDPYYGERLLRDLSARIEASARQPIQTSADPQLLLELGRELVEAGRPEEAIEILESSLGDRKTEQSSELQAELLVVLLAAHLQAAEDQNCVLHGSVGSCILPFAESALHTRPRHAREAGNVALELLDLFPEHALARWLLIISRMVSGDYPQGVPEALRLPEDALRSKADFAPWIDHAQTLGLASFDLAGGAVMDDFDGDGLLDIITSTADPCDHLKAFRNDGRGGFEEVSERWGLDSQLGGLNLIHADYDNDGRLDLLVLRGGWLGANGRIRNSLLHNELDSESGRFVDRTHEAGLAEPAHPTQTAAWADYDGDGDLDLYVGNEAPGSEPGPAQLFENQLFQKPGIRSDGFVRFRDVAAEVGVRNDSFAKGVAWGDYDNDGDPDLYVSNVGPNRLYRNNGDGSFTDVAPELGVDRPLGRSFATWFFDYDNDGRLDLFVADYGQSAATIVASYFGAESPEGQPLIYHNEGGSFREVSRSLGLTRPILPMGANYGDLDNDGWLDFYLGTGEPTLWVLLPNIMLRNVEGRRFEDITFAAGFGHLQKGHAVAFGDLDNDGDQDLFHQLGGFYPGDAFGNALFANPGTKGSWITLRLRGTQANRFGLGARIRVRVRDADASSRSIYRVAGSGGSFGGSSMQQEIGLGSAESIEEVTIVWPGSGTEQHFVGVEPRRFYSVVEGEPELRAVTLPVLDLWQGR